MSDTTEPKTVTRLLQELEQGVPDARARLFACVQSELSDIARKQMAGERANHTLPADGLVNEAYLRLTKAGQLDFENRQAFFAATTRIMKEILVDWARRKAAQKRGGKRGREPLENAPGQELSPEQILDVADALTELVAAQPQLAQVVEYRFFGGLSIPETAGLLECSTSTVDKLWSLAKKWLSRRLRAYSEGAQPS